MIELTAVTSGRISEYGYDEDLQIIYVRFHNGRLWQYRNAPPHIWLEFQLAPSKDQYIRAVLDQHDHGPA